VAEACGFEEEIEKFQRSIRHIKPLLEDAEQQQANNKALKSWLIQHRAVAYDADDLLDEFSLSLNHISDGLQSSSSGRFFKYKFVENVVSSFRSYASNVELFPKLKRMRQNLDDLVCDMSSFHLKQLSVEFDGRRQTGSFIINRDVFGRENDKEKILEMVLKNNNERGQIHGTVSVIAVVGLAGIGKTTLTQLTYNDERVSRVFDLKIWVSVNEDFCVEDIMRSIIESVTKKGCEKILL
jgi:structure-specific endonuclease subunit SLX1